MFDQTIALSRSTDNMHLVMLSFSHLARMQSVQGRLHQAAETYREATGLCRPATQFAQESTIPPSPLLGMVYVGLGDVLYEWNELQRAQANLRQGIDLAEPWHNWETLVPGYLTLARLHAAQGDWTGAVQTLAGLADRLPPLQSPWGMPLIRAHQAQIALWQGDLESAAAWVRQTGLTVDGDLAYTSEPEAIILARVLVGLGRLDDALRLGERLLAAAEAGERSGRVIELLVIQSLALQAQGKPEAALVALERALMLAEPEGYVRVFVDEGLAMGTLLQQAAVHGMAPDYVRRLLPALGAATAARRPPTATDANLSLVEPLSQRELEILRLVVEGLSNREIAERLVLAVGTIKAHVHSIYGKLGVQGRVQAIVRAGELNLL
jgi:LuxR family maltose regulon positive regulatory protein